jgi:hypothetical protein
MIVIHHHRSSQMGMMFFEWALGFLIDRRRAAGVISAGVLMHKLAGAPSAFVSL